MKERFDSNSRNRKAPVSYESQNLTKDPSLDSLESYQVIGDRRLARGRTETTTPVNCEKRKLNLKKISDKDVS